MAVGGWVGNSLALSKSSGSVQILYEHIREGGGSEGNAYFAYKVRVGVECRGKMLILLM